jgi:hypothetical protein
MLSTPNARPRQQTNIQKLNYRENNSIKRWKSLCKHSLFFGSQLPSHYCRRLERFCYGAGAFKID